MLALLVTSVAILAPMVAAWAISILKNEQSARQAAQHSHQEKNVQLYTAKVKSIQSLTEKRNYARAAEVLESLRPAREAPDLRDFEWYYWKAQLDRGLLAELTGYGSLETVAISSDSRWLAFGGSTGFVHALELTPELATSKVKNSKHVSAFSGDSERIYRLAFSPRNQHLAIGLDTKTVIIWEPKADRIVTTLATKGSGVRALAFSPDGRLLAAGTMDGSVEIWDCDQMSGLVIPGSHRSISVSNNGIGHLAIAPDNQRIATVGGEYFSNTNTFVELYLVDLQRNQVAVRRNDLPLGGRCLQFHAKDGGIYADARDTFQVCRLDSTTLDITHSYTYESRSTCMLFSISPDGETLLASGSGGELVSWSLSSGHVLQHWTGHSDRVMEVDFFPDGERFTSAGRDGAVRIWKINAGFDCSLGLATNGAIAAPLVSFAPDGTKLFVTRDDGKLLCWDTTTRKVQWETQVAPGVSNLLVSADGTEVIRTHESGQHSWFDTANGKLLATAKENSICPKAFVLTGSGDSRLLVTGQGPHGSPPFAGQLSESIVLWDWPSHTPTSRWPAHDRRVNSLHLIENDTQLLSLGFDKVIRRWDLLNQKLLSEYRLGLEQARQVLTLDKGKTLLAIDSKGTVWRWLLETGTALPALSFREGIVRGVAVSPSGSTLAICFGSLQATSEHATGSVQLVDTRTWDEKLTLPFQNSTPCTVDFSEDGQHLAVGTSTGDVYLWTALFNSDVIRIHARSRN